MAAREVSRAASCAGFVLAGGASSRFGRDKALVEFRGDTLLARLSAMLRTVSPQVTVVGSLEKYAALGMPCLADRWPGQGPLGGIITALEASADSTDIRAWNLILGCDMPFLTTDWLAYLVRRAAESSRQVVVPQSSHGLEPLCACWRTDAVDVLRSSFERGTRRVVEAMKQLQMEVLDETQWKRFDSAERLFWNMNTPVDYDEARRILEAEQA